MHKFIQQTSIFTLKNIILFILANLTVIIGLSQNSRPFIQNYTPKEYDAYIQNWDAVQDSNGVMYFANNYGILTYNGNTWELLGTGNISMVRSLAIDDNGTIWVGGVSQFGYLKISKKGSLDFFSVTDSLLDDIGEFGNVWNITYKKDKIFLSTDDGIFEYNKGVIKKLNITTDKFFIKVNDSFYASSYKKGIQQLKDNKLFNIGLDDFFRNKGVYDILPIQNNELMIVTRYNGLFWVKGDTVKTLGNKKEQEFFKKNQLYCGIKLKDGDFCLGTIKDGAIIVDKQGHIKEIFDKSIGIQNNTCWNVYQDIQGNIWLMLDKGITKIEYTCPFSLYNQNVGIEGTIMSIKRFNNELYLATSVGIYYSASGKSKKEEEGGNLNFKLLSSITGQCWDLEVMNDHLLVASSSGLFSINKKNAISVLNNDIVYTLKPSKIYANLVFIGKDNQFSMGVFDNKWKEYAIDSTNYQVRSIYEESENNVWLGTFSNGAINVNYELSSNFKPIKTKVKEYGVKEGLFGYEVDVFSYNDEVVFSTDAGLMKKKERNNKLIFYNDSTFGTQFCDSTRLIYRLHQDNNQNIWMYAPSSSGNSDEGLGYATQKGRQIKWNYKLFNRLPQGLIFSIYPETENKNIWFGGVEGLIRFNATINDNKYNSIFYTILNKVQLGNDSLIYKGNSSSIYTPVKINFTNNNLLFTYSCTNFYDEKRNQYQYKLEGFDDNWSRWTKDAKKQYTNLLEGNYTFVVRSKNLYGDIGLLDKYSFQILPPWYRTWYAYLFYALFFLLLVYTIVKVSIYRLKLANLKLEDIIAERTIIIREKNNQLGEALTDIKDSILYAKRLQDAILPKQGEINAIFKQNFIFYQPRDIVSGDFYWVTQKGNKKIFIVADCTGHGVPGAFVSMLGNNLLNQIVNEKNITSPDLILNNLNKGVSKSFKNVDKSLSANDGMDISICVVTDDNILEYAGAQRPLVMVRNNVLTEIKADKTPIGGRTSSVYKFTNNTFNLLKGDLIYMFSDGYADQFGGDKGKKFLKKRLKEVLQNNADYPLNKQKSIIKNTFFKWKGDTDQLDDVLLIGIKI